jgi:ABC-type transport system involved in cytochrome c biogenesis permease subunit
MSVHLHQLAAALYLVAGVVAWGGMALRAARAEKAAVYLLAAAAVAHLGAFATLHSLEPTPPLTELPAAVSFMACAGTIFFLLMLRRLRLEGLTVLVAPVAFVSVFFAAMAMPGARDAVATGGGSWPHLHVLLASTGLALLGVSGMAGAIFLAEHRRLKSKRPMGARLPLPTLEALDRTNRVSLSVGFPLLTLGVVTGMFWVHRVQGVLWSGSIHDTWSAVAWAVYAVLVALRFGAHQGARQAAASAVGGFAFLVFAVIGVGLLS